MLRSRRPFRALVVLMVALVGVMIATGCQSIAGIEDRTYQPASQLCIDYCNAVQKNCTGDNAVYGKDTCPGICKNLPPGDPTEPSNANTVACRLRFAKAAASAPSEQCAAAGPGGDGTCGSPCDAYCMLFEKICPSAYNIVPDCQANCAALASHKGFSAVSDHSGDTVECRLVHLGAATLDPATHCPHAEFQSTDYCKNGNTAATCQDYCRAVTVACKGTFQQYASQAECMAVCAQLPLGTFADVSTNTVGCRYYHSFNALADPATHCPHSGPGGDGQCSKDNCEPYCKLMAKACPATAFADPKTCAADCEQVEGHKAGELYKSASTPMLCRLQAVSRAIAARASSQDGTADAECQKAVGQTGCQ